jgi:hypothetical protein
LILASISREGDSTFGAAVFFVGVVFLVVAGFFIWFALVRRFRPGDDINRP